MEEAEANRNRGYELDAASDDSQNVLKKEPIPGQNNTEQDGPGLFQLVGLGLNLVADIVGLTLVGIGLDFVLKSYPVFTSIGVFTGIAVASISTWMLMRKFLK